MSQGGYRASCAHASLSLLESGFAMDEPIRSGLMNGIELLDELLLGVVSRTSSTFSCRTIVANRLVTSLETMVKAGELLADAERVRDQMRALVAGRGPVKYDELLKYFWDLMLNFTRAEETPTGCVPGL